MMKFENKFNNYTNSTLLPASGTSSSSSSRSTSIIIPINRVNSTSNQNDCKFKNSISNVSSASSSLGSSSSSSGSNSIYSPNKTGVYHLPKTTSVVNVPILNASNKGGQIKTDTLKTQTDTNDLRKQFTTSTNLIIPITYTYTPSTVSSPVTSKTTTTTTTIPLVVPIDSKGSLISIEKQLDNCNEKLNSYRENDIIKSQQDVIYFNTLPCSTYKLKKRKQINNNFNLLAYAATSSDCNNSNVNTDTIILNNTQHQSAITNANKANTNGLAKSDEINQEIIYNYHKYKNQQQNKRLSKSPTPTLFPVNMPYNSQTTLQFENKQSMTSTMPSKILSTIRERKNQMKIPLNKIEGEKKAQKLSYDIVGNNNSGLNEISAKLFNNKTTTNERTRDIMTTSVTEPLSSTIQNSQSEKLNLSNRFYSLRRMLGKKSQQNDASLNTNMNSNPDLVFNCPLQSQSTCNQQTHYLSQQFRYTSTANVKHNDTQFHHNNGTNNHKIMNIIKIYKNVLNRLQKKFNINETVLNESNKNQTKQFMSKVFESPLLAIKRMTDKSQQLIDKSTQTSDIEIKIIDFNKESNHQQEQITKNDKINQDNSNNLKSSSLTSTSSSSSSSSTSSSASYASANTAPLSTSSSTSSFKLIIHKDGNYNSNNNSKSSSRDCNISKSQEDMLCDLEVASYFDNKNNFYFYGDDNHISASNYTINELQQQQQQQQQLKIHTNSIYYDNHANIMIQSFPKNTNSTIKSIFYNSLSSTNKNKNKNCIYNNYSNENFSDFGTLC